MMIDLWKRDPDWVRKWFNSPAYHILYANRSESEALDIAQRLKSVVFDDQVTRILDLGCGAGRHAAAFHQMGYDVTGIDLSENNIACAIQTYGTSQRLKFMKGDMRQLNDSDLMDRQDAVVLLFTSIGYFEADEDYQSTLLSISNALESNGLLVIDYLNVDWVQEQLLARETQEISGHQFEIHRRIHQGWIEKSIQVNTPDGENFHVLERVQALGESDWIRMLESNGFVFQRSYFNYDFDPLVSNGPRCILVARKKPCG